MKKSNVSSLSKISLKRQLWLAATFATIFPAAITFHYWYNSYQFSRFSLTIIVSIVILGWWFVFRIFSSISKLCDRSNEVISAIDDKKPCAATNLALNEVEKLDVIFSQLSQKVKSSVDELKEVSSRTEELNKAITQKVNVLSAMLQASILFSKETPVEEIFQFLIERLQNVLSFDGAALFLKKSSSEEYISFFSSVSISKEKEIMQNSKFSEFITVKEQLVCESTNDYKGFLFIKEDVGFGSFVISPIYLHRKILGVLVLGKFKDNISLSDEDLEIVELFSRDMGMLWEYQRLSKKVDDLETNDPLTGFYNRKSFFTRLDEELKRAQVCQRPCGLLMLKIDNFEQYKEQFDKINTEMFLKKIVRVCKDHVRPVDILGRVGDYEIGIILIERNKNHSLYTGKKISEAAASALEGVGDIELKISFAVAESPINGSTADELVAHIKNQLKE